MLSKKSKISRTKAIENIADLLLEGKTRREIVQTFTENYKCSTSSVDKWIKAAAPLVSIRQEEAEVIRQRETEAIITESAKRLNITRERVLEEYAKIAFLDIRKLFTVDGGLMPIKDIDDESAGALAGIDTQDVYEGELYMGTMKKIKIEGKRAALDSICKMLGYNAAEIKEIKGTVDFNNATITFE